MAVHCIESGCIGLKIPSHLDISLGLCPRDISRASEISSSGMYNPIHPPPLSSVRIQSAFGRLEGRVLQYKARAFNFNIQYDMFNIYKKDNQIVFVQTLVWILQHFHIWHLFCHLDNLDNRSKDDNQNIPSCSQRWVLQYAPYHGNSMRNSIKKWTK